MLISVLISRDLAQNMVVRASKWHPGLDDGLMFRVLVPCTGPMNSREALIAGIRALLVELEERGLLGLAGGASDAGQQH